MCGGKGLAKVTFDWILADQSDSTAQNLGRNCVGERSQSSAYSRLQVSCCFHSDHFVWHWSTSTTEATTDDLDNRSSPFFESWGMVDQTGARKSPFKTNTVTWVYSRQAVRLEGPGYKASAPFARFGDHREVLCTSKELLTLPSSWFCCFSRSSFSRFN